MGVGIAIGLVSAFIFKHFKSLQHHPVLEVFLIILFGYASYLFAELLELSGIMTLFFCGVIMSHYSYHNISHESKIGSVISITTLGFTAEAFLYTYLGLSIFSTESSSFSLSFAFLVIISAMLSRFGSIFISIAIFSLFKKCVIDVNCKQLTLIFFSGMIRGAIAFALSLEIKEEIAIHRDQMVSTTLMVVLITTIVLGGIMSAFAKLIGLETETNGEEDKGSHSLKIDILTDIVLPKTKKKSWIQLKFNWLDDKILKPLFGGDLSKLQLHKEERSLRSSATKLKRIKGTRIKNKEHEKYIQSQKSEKEKEKHLSPERRIIKERSQSPRKFNIEIQKPKLESISEVDGN